MNTQDRLRKAERDIAELNKRLAALAITAGGFHNVLSSIHQDTLAAAVQQGDMIIGNATPRWSRVAQGIAGDYWKIVAGIPAWGPVTGTIGEEDCAFYDTFGDASLFWGWGPWNTSATKTIVEAGGKLTISIGAATQGVINASVISAPYVKIGAAGYPLIFWGKLDAWAGNDDNHTGIFISQRLSPSASLYTFTYGRCRDDGTARNGLSVYRNNSADPGTELSYVAVTTLPIWLRCRINCPEYSGTGQFFFDYSTDGINWTNQWTYSSIGEWVHSYQSHAIGLFARNFTATATACYGEFDAFKMWQNWGPA